MIKEILQENNNKSLSKEKINQKKLNSILNGIDIYKKLNSIKKQYQHSYRKNKNLDLLLNKDENIYIKKVTNLKANSINPTKKEKIKTILERNKIVPFDQKIYTFRESIKKYNTKNNDETKTDYISNRINSNREELINNLNKDFEVRCLHRKLEKLKMKNNELKYNLEKKKKKNYLLKYNSKKEQNNINNIFYSLMNIYNTFFQNKPNHNDNKLNFKNLLLDLMDLKYNYENIALINTFFQNLGQLIQLSFFFNNNDDIYSNITYLVKKKNQLLKDIYESKKHKEENKNYSELYKILCESFQANDLNTIFNHLKKIESDNENDIRKIIKMKNILFNIENSTSNRLNTNISMDKLRKNKRKNLNLNYSDLQKFYFDNNKINNGKKINKGNYTDRNKTINTQNLILNLKNHDNYINLKKKVEKNNKIDIEKIKKFLNTSKNDIDRNFPKRNKEISKSFNYINFEDIKEENNKNERLRNKTNLTTASTNITQSNNMQNNIYLKNNENNMNINEHIKINYNESINNNKMDSRKSYLKRINNYHPIYY
jgi:hypothetical protein